MLPCIPVEFGESVVQLDISGDRPNREFERHNVYRHVQIRSDTGV